MNPIFTIKKAAASALTVWSSVGFAHENHGMSGAHWHATDVWGFVAFGGALAVALWWSRGGK